MTLSKIAASLLGVIAIAGGCATQSPPAAPVSQSSSPAQASAATASASASTTLRQFDPQWMTLAISPSWMESDRRITGEFQQFGLRPADETDLPRGCNGCGVEPATAHVTVYNAGKFDPSPMRSGQSLEVSSGTGGFYVAPEGGGDAVLAWQYANDAWATVRGTTARTSEPDRMLELARALRPKELTAIHLPLSIPDVPASMPLAEINVDRGQYGTTLVFAPCGGTDVGRTLPCQVDGGSLRVQIWPTDDAAGHVPEGDSVPARIGGKDGHFGKDGTSAAVQVQPGMLVVFESSHVSTPIKDILATLTWAPDPGSEQTWRPVSDWTKAN